MERTRPPGAIEAGGLVARAVSGRSGRPDARRAESPSGPATRTGLEKSADQREKS